MSSRNLYQVSTSTILSHLEKLSLQPGDVLVCRDLETLRFLSEVKMPLNFTVPLVYSPQGLQKLTRSDLMNLIEQIDQSTAPAHGIGEASRAPL